MFKLLTNYIREQKNSLIQIFGLGFVIIIMVCSFLSLNFATTYINQQYWHDIAKEEFHQRIDFPIDPKFADGYFKDSWLENLNYFDKDTKKPDLEKMEKATFQIYRVIFDPEKHLYTYRFYYDNPDHHVFVGQKFSQTTGHPFIDFQLTIPANYPSVAKHNQYLDALAKLIDKYVSTPNDLTPNFFITSKAALDFYNENIKGKVGYATHSYDEQDIINQAKLYQLLIMGMLYGKNIQWNRVLNITDLLITGKTLSFIQTTPETKLNTPILTETGSMNVDPKNLGDNEILIYKEFAEENHLKIGQNYIFSGYKFKIVGFATSAEAANNANYFWGKSDNSNQTVAFVNQATIDKISNNPYAMVYNSDFAGYNPEIGCQDSQLNINNQWAYQYFHQKLLNDTNINKRLLYFATKNAVHNQLLFNPLNTNSRSIAIESTVWTSINNLKGIFFQIASTFLGLIFVVVSVIVFIVIYKMIDRNKQLIGILKAHGYPAWKLNIALVVATIFPIVIFAILGSALAIIVGHFIVTTYSTAIILISYGWPFYYQIALLVVLIPFVVLAIISFMMVAFLLRVNALTLINNSWAKSKYNAKITNFFSSLISKMIQNFNYYNKLAITTAFRSFGKIVFVIIVSVFASTLLLFSFASAGLVNNLLGLQFASINYNYNNKYDFGYQVSDNFINGQNNLLYKKENVADIRSQPSLYWPIRQALEKLIADPKHPAVVNLRYGYLMGSELYKIRKEVVEPNFDKFPQDFQHFWNQNIYFIDYLTNQNGKKDVDLMINFGLLPYDSAYENPYTELNFYDAHHFDINSIDTSKYFYDNQTNVLMGDWSKIKGVARTAYGINDQSSAFLNPGFKNTNFNNFTNLNLSDMTTSGGWLNNNFLAIRNTIIKKFNIANPDSASVKIIPMVGSTVPGTKNTPGGEGDDIGETVLYRYRGLDSQTKYIIGVMYDGAKNLLQNTILMPSTWLNSAIVGNDSLATEFANSKFTKFDHSELYRYLPIISKNNDYVVDLSKVSEANYLQAKGISPGLTMLYDVRSIKEMFEARQYSLQILLALFAFFSVLLSFMIVIIISNINIRDNLVLIETLRSLGYSSLEISYVFLLVTVPLLIIFSLFAIFIAPLLTAIVAGAISNFLSLNVPVLFRWWYIALTLLVVLLIYFLSYIITWKLNVNQKKLRFLTK